jgi:hypothetical protein
MRKIIAGMFITLDGVVESAGEVEPAVLRRRAKPGRDAPDRERR